VIGDSLQEHLVHDSEEIEQFLPGLFVSRVDSLADTDTSQPFLDDLLLEKGVAAVSDAE
jgi:hypothetical protein